MGKAARKMKRAALSAPRKARKKAIHKAMRQAAIQRVVKDKAQRLVAKSMKERLAKQAQEVVDKREPGKDLLGNPLPEKPALADPDAIREQVVEAGGAHEPSEVVSAFYLVQLPESICDDGSIAVDKPVDPEPK